MTTFQKMYHLCLLCKSLITKTPLKQRGDTVYCCNLLQDFNNQVDDSDESGVHADSNMDTTSHFLILVQWRWSSGIKSFELRPGVQCPSPLLLTLHKCWRGVTIVLPWTRQQLLLLSLTKEKREAVRMMGFSSSSSGQEQQHSGWHLTNSTQQSSFCQDNGKI